LARDGDDGLGSDSIATGIALGTAFFQPCFPSEVPENHRQASGSTFDGVHL
jgi:hypothetical protein